MIHVEKPLSNALRNTQEGDEALDTEGTNPLLQGESMAKRQNGTVYNILLIGVLGANKSLHKTNTTLGNFSIRLSHNVSLLSQGSSPVATARCGLVSAGV
ncbi:MAG: hypothetical protein GY794_05490, partial [bacterium]|nr:hypothetical protein [bacterium]